jgi:GNAT superfamily N-acetyltransferase
VREAALRPPSAGDLDWVVAAHGRLYAAEFGWDDTFRALVAGIVVDFVRDFDPALENAWIATLDGAPVGSVFLVRGPDAGTAKLRMLILDPAARGHGLGRRLVRQCEAFAREKGYRRITLWTHSVLLAARALYAAEGYALVASAPHHSFGHDLVEETWVKVL